MKKRVMKVMLVLGLIMAVIAASAFIYLRQAKFGLNPYGNHLAQISQSPNYRDGEFKNIIERPVVIHRDSRVKSFLKFLFTKKERAKPAQAMPAMKADLKSLDRNQDLFVWLGHSSYYFQLDGHTILVDPVLSDHAAPVSFANQAFAGATPYQAEDFPDIDYLLITHDHWDHLDYPTVISLKPRIKNIVVPLGVASHFLHWGFSPSVIKEADWNQIVEAESLKIHVLPAHHYSGRWLDRNKTLWAAFALVTDSRKIFISGDSGYSPHFEEIGRAFGGFDLALLDSGQYDPMWPYIHMNPEEAAAAAKDLSAKAFLPAHTGKFAIAKHSWDDPFIRANRAASVYESNYELWTPIIGQAIELDGDTPKFFNWWEPLR